MGCCLIKLPPPQPYQYVPIEGPYGKPLGDLPATLDIPKPTSDGTSCFVTRWTKKVNIEVHAGFNFDGTVEYRNIEPSFFQTLTTQRVDVKLPVSINSSRTDCYPNGGGEYLFTKQFFSLVFEASEPKLDGQESLTLPGSGVSVLCTKYSSASVCVLYAAKGTTVMYFASDASLPVPVRVTVATSDGSFFIDKLLDSQEMNIAEVPEFDLEELKAAMNMDARDNKSPPWKKPDYKTIGKRSIRTYKYILNQRGSSSLGVAEMGGCLEWSPDLPGGLFKQYQIVDIKGFAGKLAALGGNKYTVDCTEFMGIAGDVKWDVKAPVVENRIENRC